MVRHGTYYIYRCITPSQPDYENGLIAKLECDEKESQEPIVDYIWWHYKINFIPISVYWTPPKRKKREIKQETIDKMLRTRYINKIKRRYPLFAEEFIQEKYPDYKEKK